MSKGNRYKKQEKRGTRIISLILLVIFGALFLISGFNIIKYIIDSNNNNKIINEISKSIVIQKIENDENKENETGYEVKINFEDLKQKNPDTVAFLKINGTNIENIVTKSTDNSFYLYHNFEKNSNGAGWIFADYRNRFDGTDKNIIIYGHNMRNGTMFGTLKNILNENWKNVDENRYITFSTEKENAIYEVFSVYQIEAEDYYIQTDFNTDKDYNTFLNVLKKRSKYDFGVGINEKDQILTLSTCANNNKYRVILHAKKINQN